MRDRIINLEYPPETRLSEEELCKEFQVSRTPLREALHELADMNLIQSIPRYGTIVKPVDVHEVRNAYEVKVHLESLAGSLAAQRIKESHLERLRRILLEYQEAHRSGQDGVDKDVYFHEVVYEATQNQVLENTLNKLTSRCIRLCKLIIPEHMDTGFSIASLSEIYEALESRDQELSADRCREHAQYYLDRIREVVV